MFKTVFAVVSALAVSANAAILVRVSDATISAGSTGTVNVFLELSGADLASPPTLSGFNITLQAESPLTFTGTFAASSPAYPSVANFTSMAESTGGFGYTLGEYVTITGSAGSPGGTVANGTANGLFQTTVSVPAGTPLDTYSITVLGPDSFAFDGSGNNELTLTAGQGTITVVPEPATLGLIGLAGVLVTRRRR